MGALALLIAAVLALLERSSTAVWFFLIAAVALIVIVRFGDRIQRLHLSQKGLDIDLKAAEKAAEWLEFSEAGLREQASLGNLDDDVVEQELSRRRQVATGLHPDGSTTEYAVHDIVGIYSTVGHNPDDEAESYVGTLAIREDAQLLNAVWEIGSTGQRHEGVGLIKGTSVAFLFRYADNGDVDHGVVLYEILGKDVLRGRWTGFDAGNSGFEECRRLDLDEVEAFRQGVRLSEE